MTTEEIKRIQKIVGTTPDGKLGPITKAAIITYQQKLGVTADGEWGPITEAAYNKQNNSNSSSGNTSMNQFDENYQTAGDTKSSNYGNTENLNNEGLNEKTVRSDLKIAGDLGIINPNFIRTLLADPSIIALYTHALTYGDYQVGDMINDVSRRELISNGNTQLEDLKIIDPEVVKAVYQATVEGTQSKLDTAKSIPTFDFQGLFNPEIINHSGSNMPPELFDSITPKMDPNSQEFKDAVATLKATYFDLASASLGAETEQKKAIADENLKQFTKNLNEKYGIILSDNADKAWTQMENIGNTMTTRGLSGSGIENEAIDQTLEATRKADQRQRMAKLTEKEQEEMNALLTSGKPEEIAAAITRLDAEDAKNGVSPDNYRSKIFKVSSDIANQFNVDTLLAKHPKWTREMAQAVHDANIDINGNALSSIYRTYYNSLATANLANQETAVNQVTATNNLNDEINANNTIGDTTGADPLNPIVPNMPTASGNGNTPVTTNFPVLDTEQFNRNTGAPNPNYKPPTPTTNFPVLDTEQFNRNTGAPNPNYKVPATASPSTVPKPTPTVSTPTPTTPARTGYSGSSIVDYLSSVGQDSSYTNRKKLYGGTTYSGTSTENTELLKRLRGY